jgi:uncharacterized protein
MVKIMVDQQTAINIVKGLSKDILSLGIHLRKVVLFGSYAKNTAVEHSDIDVLLVADEFTGIGFEDIGLFTSALRKFNNFHLKTLNSVDIIDGDPIVSEILKSGIEISLS